MERPRVPFSPPSCTSGAQSPLSLPSNPLPPGPGPCCEQLVFCPLAGFVGSNVSCHLLAGGRLLGTRGPDPLKASDQRSHKVTCRMGPSRQLMLSGNIWRQILSLGLGPCLPGSTAPCWGDTSPGLCLGKASGRSEVWLRALDHRQLAWQGTHCSISVIVGVSGGWGLLGPSQSTRKVQISQVSSRSIKCYDSK